jgi:hypothetical protein
MDALRPVAPGVMIGKPYGLIQVALEPSFQIKLNNVFIG